MRHLIVGVTLLFGETFSTFTGLLKYQFKLLQFFRRDALEGKFDECRVPRTASTFRFYRDTIELNITPVIGQLRLRDVQTVHIQRLLDAKDLSHGSLLRIKSAASAIFSHAKRLGFINGVNPVQGALAAGRRSDFEGHAYSLGDLQFFLEKLGEPARTVVGTAAFPGLRESEIRGLQWADYTGDDVRSQSRVENCCRSDENP